MKSKLPVSISVFLLLHFSCGKKTETPESDFRETEKALVDVNRVLIKKDHEKIKAYIQRNSLQMEETPTGLWVGISGRGTGEKAQPGMTAAIKYRLSLLDGTICYDSDSLGLKTFRIGHGGVESGLEEGILLLREGDRATFIMPPHLAHGLPGDGNRIPARSIIMYDVELVKLVP